MNLVSRHNFIVFGIFHRIFSDTWHLNNILKKLLKMKISIIIIIYLNIKIAFDNIKLNQNRSNTALQAGNSLSGWVMKR